ncbi:MAG: hypothetical protein ACOCRK_09405 [bacterium]
MKLGQKVKFSKELKKGENLPYSDKLYYEYKDGLRWGTVEHEEEIEGIICGKRTIAYRGSYDPDYFEFNTKAYKQVYLIATDMRGFHRVPEEWLTKEEVSEDAE